MSVCSFCVNNASSLLATENPADIPYTGLVGRRERGGGGGRGWGVGRGLSLAVRHCDTNVAFYHISLRY